VGVAAFVVTGCNGATTEDPILGPPDSSPISVSPAASSSGASASGSGSGGGVGSGASGASASGASAAGAEPTPADAMTADTTAADAGAITAEATAGDSASVDTPAGDASADAMVCRPGTAQCSGNSLLVCNPNGQWQTPWACPSPTPFCNEAICGVCPEGATQCAGYSLQVCGPDGSWSTPWTCATGTCTDGACAGSTPTAASCAPGGPGMTDCGPGGSGTESCCTSLEVPGGTYYRTYDPYVVGTGEPQQITVVLAADGGPADEADPASVSNFRLDTYLVTVGRFRQYVKYVTGSTGAPPPDGSGVHTHLRGGLALLSQRDCQVRHQRA